MNSGKLNIVTAFACEARAIIDAWKLKKVEHPSRFPLFRNQEQTISLILSGLGKIKSAVATSALFYTESALAQTVFLNLGIAGLAQGEIGHLFRVNKITDHATNRAFYPFCNHKALRHIPSRALRTYDQPQTHYPEHTLLDMEASGFFEAAQQLVAHEQIHCVKLVSDNQQNGHHPINAPWVSQLMQDQLPALKHIIETALQQSQDIAHSQMQINELSDFLHRWHFTQYQQHQLMELLRRWQIHHATPSAMAHCQQQTHAREVLAHLTDLLDHASYTWE